MAKTKLSSLFKRTLDIGEDWRTTEIIYECHQMDNEKVFGVVDNCVFAGMLIISAVIGLYISYKGSKSPEEFLMGNRSLKPLPVSLSLITSYITAIALIGFPGEVYANGLQISTIALGCPLAITFSSYFLLPVLYSLKLTSINEYIELRFKSRRLRYVIFLLSMAKALAANGIGLYAPTIALSSVTNLSTLNSIFILGIICTLYSSFGGIKAVIWTDVFQFSVMLIGLMTVVGVGCAQNGGVIETLHIASEGGRLEMFNMSLSPFVRHTFLNTIASGFFYQLRMYSSEQVNIQRICAVKSVKNARRVLKYNFYGKLFMYVLTFSCGLVAYSTYAGCDPMALGLIKKKDQILPYFVIDKLRVIPGLPGLFIATIIGGALSS
ncbi:Sodium-coupled monocarboxylate transporter 1 [Armadillidium vulgare]|nr:Sodium-coupled monocarboxylate transporter 1 [Armadillidium vulgare]